MSLRAQEGVWARSRTERMDLLVLLALADYADVDGRHAAPVVSLLATRLRLPESELLQRLHRLEQAGELVVEQTTESPRTHYHLRCCYDPLYDIEQQP
jgi:hypothetical protein